MLWHGAAQLLRLALQGSTVTSTVKAIGCSCMVLYLSSGHPDQYCSPLFGDFTPKHTLEQLHVFDHLQCRVSRPVGHIHQTHA